MQVIHRRTPRKNEAGKLFLVCVFFVHVWAVLTFLFRISIFANRTTILDMIGIFAYVMVIALIESILFFSILTFLNFMFPDRIFRNDLIGFGTIYLICFFVWVIPVHLKEFIEELVHGNDIIYYLLFTVWFLYCLMLIIVLARLLIQNNRFKEAINRFADRITVLSGFYLGIDMVSLFVVLYRNLVK